METVQANVITMNLKALKVAIRNLDNPIKKKILNFLQDGKRTVTEIVIHMQMPQPVISQHLAGLRKTKVVLDQRDGRTIFYSLNTRIIDWFNDMSENFKQEVA